MKMLDIWMKSPGAIALGWTLVHSLWEGAAIALLLACGLAVLRTAHSRYTASCLAMLALLASFAVTYERIRPENKWAPTFENDFRISQAGSSADGKGKLPRRSEFQDYLPWLAACWIAGVVFFQVRGAANWMGARRLRMRGVFPAPESWRARTDLMRERLSIGAKVELLESYLADVPMVMGYFRPVILMPAGLLMGLPVSQIEAILAHELAHIRRNDYLVNLGQVLVEGLLFYHPAVWWISSAMRAERENCCDDLAVEISGDPVGYASALATLETNRSEMAPAATGGNLVKRVRRLLGQADVRGVAMTPMISALVLAVTLAAGVSAWQPPSPQANTPYDKWLKEDVVYIIQDQERTGFQRLTTSEEREHFIEQFWERRNPVAGSTANAFKIEHYRRIGYVNEHYGTATLAGWRSDRGRVYIKYGPADEIESHPSGGKDGSPPFEQWRYRLIQGVGTNVIIEFRDEARTGDFRMTRDPHEHD